VRESYREPLSRGVNLPKKIFKKLAMVAANSCDSVLLKISLRICFVARHIISRRQRSYTKKVSIVNFISTNVIIDARISY
jgi:hypothetical protein